MLDLKELSESLSSPFRIKEDIVTTSLNSNSSTFKCRLIFEDLRFNETIGDCQWMVKQLPESYYIHLWPYSDLMKCSSLSDQNFVKLNQRLKFGHLKKLKDNADIATICIFQTFRTDMASLASHKDIIIKTIKMLASQFCELMINLDNLKNYCPDCELEIQDCMCEEILETDEKTVKVWEGLKRFKDSQLFDFSEEFYDNFNSVYYFNPSDLLENKLRISTLSRDFVSLLDEFIMKLDQNSLYLNRNPMNLLMFIETENNDKKLILAPALEKKEIFEKYFSDKPTDFDFKHEIIKRINSNITKQPAVHDFLPLNYLSNPENLKMSKLAFGKFYSLYQNELLDGSKIIIKIPNSNDNLRVEHEYLISLECQYCKNIVTPIRLVKIGHKIGIVCLNFKGQLLEDQYKSLTTQDKFRVMEDVAEFLEMIHSKGIYHANINPKTIVLVKNKGQVLNMKYATKCTRIKYFSVNSLMFSDPEMLISRNVGYYSDVWSWALTFISLFTELNPYKQVLSPELFIPESQPVKIHISDLSEQIYSEIIKNQKLPLIDTLALPSEIISLLGRCLNFSYEKRPTMKEIVESLRIRIS